MALVLAPGEAGVVEIDLCRRCHIAWIDEGEWEQLPKKPTLPEGEVSVRAVEILGRAEGDRITRDEPWPQMWWPQWVVASHGLPVRDDTEPVFLTPVTLMVGILMVVATVAAYIYGLDEAVARFGLIPAEADRLGGLTMFTSFFLHGSVGHLLGNLYFLIVIGSAVEMRIGSQRTAIVLVASLATALVVHMVLDPHPANPVVGASGGIAGLFVLFVFAFPKVPFQILVVSLPIVRWFRVSAATLGGLLLAYNVVGALFQLGGWSSVSSLGHLGGAGAGIIFWLAWRAEIKRAHRVASVVSHRQLTSV